jgi:hypothetical protein
VGVVSERAKREDARRSRGRWLGGGLAERASSGLGALVAQADRGAERLMGAARELRRSPALQHGLAAQARGNLEAAFWLLAEEYGDGGCELEVAARYWEVALQLKRVDLAADAGTRLVEHHAASGGIELAAQYWIELVSAVPDTLVSPKAIASLLPALRRRLEDLDRDDLEELRGLGRRALRQAVDPRNEGLSPGVAFRLFEDGRELNPEAARRAAEVALDSPGLHELKRTRISAWLEGKDPDEAVAELEAARAPAPAPPPLRERVPAPLPVETLSEGEIATAVAHLPLSSTETDGDAPPPLDVDFADLEIEIMDAVPVELAVEGLVLREASGLRARITYAVIEAISMAELGGLAKDPVRVVDLVLNWTRRAEEPVRIVRLRADDCEAAALASETEADGKPLALFVEALLERSSAVPFPDRDTVLGLRVARFPSPELYLDHTFRLA